MALSGSLSTNKYSNTARYYKLTWSATQDINTNTSTINYTLSAEGSGWWAERTLEVKLGGTTIISKTERVERWDGVIKTGTIKLQHDSDGKKTFSASIRAAVYGSSVNLTASDDFTLNPIPRGATITELSEFTDENNPTITYENPAGNNATSIKVFISTWSTATDIFVERTDISKTGNKYTFYLTEEERVAMRKRFYNATQPVIGVGITVVVDGKEFTQYRAWTFKIINSKPLLIPTVKDIHIPTLQLTGDENTIIKGKNIVEYDFGAVPQKEATIVSYSLTCGNKTSSTATGEFSNVESNIFTFSIEDSRGNTLTRNVELNMIDYTQLTCSQEVHIELTGETEATVNLTIKGNYYKGSFGAANNQLWLKYAYKVGDGDFGDWISVTATPTLNDDNQTYSVSFDVTGLSYDNAYTFISRAADMVDIAQSTEYAVKLIPVFDWSDNDFNFNVPVSIQGYQIGNFIIEEDESNGWKYTKWKDGRVELHGKFENTGGVNQAKGSLFRSNGITVDLPFTVYDCHCSSDCNNGNAWTSLASYNTNADSVRYILWSPWSDTTTSYTTELFVVGRWKQ